MMHTSRIPTFRPKVSAPTAGPLISPLAVELVRRIKEAFPAFERLIRYWPQYAPLLAGALGEAFMHGGDAIIRQCGLSTSQELGGSKGSAIVPAVPQAERSARRLGGSVAGGSGKGGESLRSAVGSAVGSKVGSFLGLRNARSSHPSLPPPDHCKCAPHLPDVALSSPFAPGNIW